jgi:hypothetical protein
MSDGVPRGEFDDVNAVIAEHRRRISDAVPEGISAVSGSALLGHAGHDIDLVVIVPDVADAAARLRTAYPALYEEQWRDDWAAFRDPGPPQVDIVLTRIGTKGDAHHRRAWDLILEDDTLKAEYERLKAVGMDGARKAAFFERVVAMLEADES